MRLDKYLKVSRIIKRRTVSKDIIDIGQVSLIGRKAKPSSEINVGDIITLSLGNRIVTIEVLSVNEKVKKDDAAGMYKIVKEEIISRDEED